MTEAGAIVVRRARPEDAAALHDLALSILVAYGLPQDPELLRYGARSFASSGRRHTFAELVAEDDGVVIGTLTLGMHPRAEDAGWLSKFFVDPLHRGKGAGRALLEAAIREAHRLGMRWLELQTLIVFKEAIALYEAKGFRSRPIRRASRERHYVLDLESRDLESRDPDRRVR